MNKIVAVSDDNNSTSNWLAFMDAVEKQGDYLSEEKAQFNRVHTSFHELLSEDLSKTLRFPLYHDNVIGLKCEWV